MFSTPLFRIFISTLCIMIPCARTDAPFNLGPIKVAPIPPTPQSASPTEMLKMEDKIIKEDEEHVKARAAMNDAISKSFSDKTGWSKPKDEYERSKEESDKEKQAKEKSDFMKEDSEESSGVFDEIGPAGSRHADAVTRKMSELILEEMKKISEHGVHTTPPVTPNDPKDKSSIQDRPGYMEGILSNSMSTPDSEGELDEGDVDYNSTMCPKEFVVVGSLCWSTFDYEGKCNLVQHNIVEMSELSRAAWSSECGGIWPRMTDTCPGGRNWDAPCPTSWMLDKSETYCQARRRQKDNCPPHAAFPSMTLEERESWAKRCDLFWPCNRNSYCPPDYSFQCPKSWDALPNYICRAPSTYMGPCPRFANMKEFNDKLKSNFSTVCLVHWPCQCERDYSYTHMCPLTWILLEDGRCRAPFNYTGKCDKIMDFGVNNSKTVLERQELAEDCEVNFPCRNRSSCEKDYSHLCPIYWTASINGKSCSPDNTKYETPDVPYCNSLFYDISEIDVEAKLNYESKCDVEWPCRGEMKYA